VSYQPNLNGLLTVSKEKVRIVAAEVLADTVRLCPVDTGNLARSYRMQEIPNGYRVGTNVYYAPFVEFGTYKMAAQPHLGPALEKARRKYA